MLLAGLFALALVWSYATPAAAQSQRAKEVGMKLKCLCKGCEMSAGGCAHPGGSFSGPCDTAKAELKEVDELLNQGLTEQQVIETFVRKYGTIAYMEPPKHGFGLVAWVMPILYTVVGLGVVVLVVRKWAQHRPAGTSVAQAGPKVSAEALERARAQAARETED
jgi:cytochrome c-type biogenesis protein CcmH/NrfF